MLVRTSDNGIDVSRKKWINLNSYFLKFILEKSLESVKFSIYPASSVIKGTV